MTALTPVHPLKTRARVLLSSVFGPYARDDDYGSRKINPMELYENQVTRVQGAFSLRMFHRSFGLMMIQSNIEAPCTLLDFPTRDRFVQEIKDHPYDVVGISAIIPNVGKVKEMCELVRRHQPGAVIVVGGHVANKDGLPDIIDADHIVRGEGIGWFRRFLGQDETAPIRHPMAYSAHGTRILGVTLHREHHHGNTAAIVIPSVGCPVGCNFCATSALFGGKGSVINFYETGDALFSLMCEIETTLKVNSFFMMDENFLLQRTRALRLLELIKSHQKSWSLYVFSSARVLCSYRLSQLVEMGIAWVWMGLEGKDARYRKLRGVDTYALVKRLRSHGIRVLGSSIIGLEHHGAGNMDAVIANAVDHGADFHQFMLYTPIPGTPLYEQHREKGTLLSEAAFPAADAHGQYRFNFRHAHIPAGQEEAFLLKAFRADFEVNGPSLARLIRTLLTGWQRYKHHPEERLRNRFRREVSPLRSAYAGAAWAMKKYFRNNDRLNEKLSALLRDIYREFGWPTRVIAPLIGRYLLVTLKLEEKRLAKGWTYEPKAFRERNAAALALETPSPKGLGRAESRPAIPVPGFACTEFHETL